MRAFLKAICDIIQLLFFGYTDESISENIVRKDGQK